MEEVRLLLRLSFFLLIHSVFSGYVTDDFLIFTDKENGVIWQADLIQQNLYAVYTQCNNPVSASYDPMEQRVYWTEVATFSLIRRVNVDGTAPETVFYFAISSIPNAVTVDHISRLLYYTEDRYDTVGVMRLDGSYHKILLRTGLDKPRAMTLDPVNGWMYWTDWGTEAKIERAHMDGENRQTVADTDLSWPNGIEIDIPEQQLYWCDGNFSKIEVSDPDGSKRRSLIKAGDTVGGHYFGIAVDDRKIYFTDWRFASWSFHRANKHDGSNATIHTASSFPTAKLTGVHVYRSSYHLSGSNGCSVNNGGCPYLCLPKPNGRTCACPDGESFCLPGQSTTGNVPLDTSSPAMVETSSSRTVQGGLISVKYHGGTPPASQPVSAALIAVSVVSVVIIIALVLLVVVIIKKRNAPQNSLPTNPHLNPAFDNNGNDKPERHLSSSPHQGDTSHYEGLTPGMANISSKDEHPYQQMTGNPVYEIPTFTVYENGVNDYQPILPSTREENV